ncbi:ectoine/hydroxyectoine ABC transporter permease subunit EhuD [Ancylobacter sp. A5.8]|uniref:ectoine/hydroxyectoine ABC transporter permease subunit EhuD n=1 Tax=Ancylobacter gelatini TaxID=2919920 RepID=UPI001F4EE298|nr:ectoine/hydroxyectoine ABC transporter permease subunit EhuD [Ancylobacter gelatini]MCJ8145048.1 ectoine/hydroxyectoine ABC transporter permease subunit EhuD [Ancylobacter gelatini]
MEFSFELLWEILPQLLRATVVTLEATFCGFFIALVVGLVMVTFMRARARGVRIAARLVMEFLRATPLLVQVYFLFFVLPEFGISLSPFLTGVIALGCHYGAYAAEAYRAGLEAVPKGQWEAAVSLNYGRLATYRHIVLPQALPPIVPSLGNIAIAMLKDTPILAAVTVTELMFVANEIGSERFQYTEPVTAAALIYLVLSLAAAPLINLIDRRLRPQETRA